MREILSVERAGIRVYRAAVAFACIFAIAHVIALPLLISYDGFIYIDMADVLFSSRFPADWNAARTPLYPLALNISFALFGRHAMAATAVSAAMGLAGILVLGKLVRRLAGNGAGALSIVLVSLFPTLVAYHHNVLTETGTFFFLGLVTSLSCWRPKVLSGLWLKTGALVVVVTAGFYWRQTILPLAVLAGLFHGLAAWHDFRPAGSLFSIRRFLALGTQVALIAILPFLLSRPWSRFTNDAFCRALACNQGIISQALLPPGHPYLGDQAATYEKSIADARECGNFYSGLIAVPSSKQLDEIPQRWAGRSEAVFLELVLGNPWRYCEAMARVTMLYSGCRARVNETANARCYVLNPAMHNDTNTICEGPPNMEAAVSDQFRQKSKPSILMKYLWEMCSFYDSLVLCSIAVAALGVLAGLVLRNFSLLVVYGMPLAHLAPYIVLLSSVDRYGLPTQAVALAVLPAFPVLLWKAIAARQSVSLGLQGAPTFPPAELFHESLATR